MSRFVDFWRRLVDPEDIGQSFEQRLQSTLMMSILLLIPVVVVVLFVVRAAAGQGTPPELIVRVLVVLGALFAYLCARKGHNRFASGIAVAIGTVALLLLSAVEDLRSAFLVIDYLAVVLLFSGLFFSIRGVLVIFVLQVAFVSLIIFGIRSDVVFDDFVAGPLSFMVAFGAIILIVTHYRNSLEAEYRAYLSSSEERYRTVAEFAYGWEYWIDSEGIFQYISPSCERITGYSSLEMMNNPALLTEIIAPQDQGIWQNHHDSVDSSGGFHEFQLRIVRKDGQVRWIEHACMRVVDSSGKFRGYRASNRDITDRKLAEQALKQSEMRQSALLGASPDLMFRNRADGEFLDYDSRGTQDLFNLRSNYSGRKISGVLPPELATRHQESIENVLETGEEQMYEFAYPLENQLQHFEARVVASGHDEVLTIVRNITERKLARQREFELSLEKERVNLLRSFITNASHEFRTPLSIINTVSYNLRHVTEAQRYEQQIGVVEKQVLRITKLVDMLLLLTQLESEQADQFAYLSAGMMLQRLCHEFVSKNPDGPHLHCEQAPELPDVLGAAGFLREAFSQLLDNAFRFTPEDGTVTLITGVSDDHLYVQIRDTGPGISAEHLPHIFEIFWRGDKAHTTPGFGLGCALAQKIIHRHRGSIDVESEPGKGTTVTVTLPLA